MIHHYPMFHAVKDRGFTLIESVIYIGLFGLLMSGILGTMYPFFVNSERLTGQIAIEGETAFILHKIEYALADSITTPADISDIVPSPGNTEPTLTINTNRYHFERNGTNLLYREGSGTAIPLNAERVEILSFDVEHVGPAGETDYLEVTLTARPKGGTAITTIGPVRYHLHF